MEDVPHEELDPVVDSTVDDFVAFYDEKRAYIGRVTAVHASEALLTIDVWHVPYGHRRGQLAQRQWVFGDQVLVVPAALVVAKVNLTETGSLTAESLERLAAANFEIRW